MSRGWFHPNVIYYVHDREVGSTRRFISLSGCREVGFIQRLYIISTVVRSGLPTVYYYYCYHGSFRCWGREVGYPMVYDGYMVRYIVEF